MSTALVTGVTGYIGGHMFDTLLSHHGGPAHKYIIYGRSKDKLAAVQKAYPKTNITIAVGSLEDEDALARAAEKCEIVLHWASADVEPAAKAISKGLTKRVEEGKEAFWIHTGGTGILLYAGGPYGTKSDKEFDDWDGVSEVTSIPDDALHRKVDKIVLDAANKGVKTAIVAPSCIYGVGNGKGNQRSQQLPFLCETTLKKGHGIKIGEGKTEWDAIHVKDLANIYLRLYEEALRQGGGAASWGKDGYYFGCSQRFCWGDLAQTVADYAYQKGYIKSNEVKSITPEEANELMEGSAMVLGLTSKANAIRANKVFGWTPTERTIQEEVPNAVEYEAKNMGIEKKYDTINTETVLLAE